MTTLSLKQESPSDSPKLQEPFFFTPKASSYLHLSNGMTFSGFGEGWQEGERFGEVVFTTGMTGYEASLTDPSYAGQILVFTYPLLGNYGVLDKSLWESEKIYAKGVVVCHASHHYSNSKRNSSFREWLKEQNVPLLMGIDTRQVTKVLRERGTLLGAISSHSTPPAAFPDPTEEMVSIRKYEIERPQFIGLDHGKKVFVVDTGIKANILRNLEKFPLSIAEVPWTYDYSNDDYDGVLLSNGPGDPTMYGLAIEILKKAFKKEKPIFGIGLGSQLMALAAGAETYKLPYGHRGHNQPCIDVETRRCYITSQNHGYAVREETLPSDWKVTFRNLNDNTVEGIAHRSLPFSSVQFHPEASPGPTDTEWLFKEFYSCL